jgi:NAD(P)-dependent dehydrogenase (short-subunit alcohol dehydrogenase family)
MRLDGIAALVTGGGSGLGAETARRLAKGGAKVAVLDINADAARTVAEEVGGTAIRCDVTDAAGTEAAVAQARAAHGPARILVNCAGVGVAGRVTTRRGPMPLEDFSRVIDVNLIGTFNAIRLAVADMVGLDPLADGERGVIVSTASVAAFEGQLGQAAYAASKGGIVSMTLPIARELAQFGIRVLAIAPGIFETPMLGNLPKDIQESLAASVPFPKRLGTAADYAALVAHCVENGYLNGETIRLDGALRLPPR